MYKIHYTDMAKAIIELRHSFETIEGLVRSEIQDLINSGMENPRSLMFHTIFPINSDDEFIVTPTGENDDLLVDINPEIEEIELTEGPLEGFTIQMPIFDDKED